LFVERDVTVVHAIPHGLDFWSAFQAARDLGCPYVLNVHDDMTYNLHDRVYLNRAMDRLATVWREADRRMVISDAMGRAYNDRYGDRPYEVVTDGLTPEQVASAPRSRPSGRFAVYFMGSVHLSYRRNFQSLLDALNLVAEAQPERRVRFIVRGGMPFPLDAGSVDLELRGWGTQEEVEADLDDADLLYFPLPFEPEHDAFVRFSLSTKMVTYLGSGLPILYHGPGVAAAAQLLEQNDAGVLACTDHADALADILAAADAPGLNAATWGALELARRQFMLADQRTRFWESVSVAHPAVTSVL
jgi:glycosyltransferase involved in cell wall biosynthesis